MPEGPGPADTEQRYTGAPLAARRPTSLQLHTDRYYSRALGREQPYAYFLPAECVSPASQERPRYPLLVLLHGMDGRYTDWLTYTRIARHLAVYRMVVAFPDGGNGWYTNSADGTACREDDLIQDFLPHLQATLPILPPGKSWGIGGLSMGGFGAVKFALKFPRLFSLAVSHSGSMEKPATPESHPVFGDPFADAAFRRAENPFSLAEQILCQFPPERPRLTLDCGLHDPLLEANRRFHGHLTFIGYPHEYREMPGYHAWPYWDRAFRTALPVIARDLGATPVTNNSNI